MPKKKPEAVPSPRPDVNLKDADYIATVKKPNLELSRAERVIDGHKRGLPLESLMRSTGFTPKQVFALLGKDEVAEAKQFEKLNEVYEKRIKQW